MAEARELRHVLSRAPALSFMVLMVNVCEISLVTMNNRKQKPEIKKPYYYRLEPQLPFLPSPFQCDGRLGHWLKVGGVGVNDCVLSLWPLSRSLRWSR